MRNLTVAAATLILLAACGKPATEPSVHESYVRKSQFTGEAFCADPFSLNRSIR